MSKVKKESQKKSVPSQAKNSPRSSRPALGTSPTDPKLSAWLKSQATKLKALEKKGNILKLDFVLNAKTKGAILLKVQERLSGIPGRFQSWVEESTGIGYSTALLWIDVAKNYGDVSEQFVNFNPLELTVRQVRDALRDARQKRGEGKPGSGRKKTATAPPADNQSEEDDSAQQSETEDATEDAAPDNDRWEQAAAAAEAEAAEVSGAAKNEPKPQHYKVVVTVANEGDQANIQTALSNWSPTSVMPIGTKQVRSVSAHVRPNAIGTALQRLGKALESNPPKMVKVSVEL